MIVFWGAPWTSGQKGSIPMPNSNLSLAAAVTAA